MTATSSSQRAPRTHRPHHPAPRLHLQIEPLDVPAFRAVSDDDERFVRRLTRSTHDSFGQLLRGAAEARVIVVLDRAGATRNPREIEVLADLSSGVDFIPFGLDDYRQLAELGLQWGQWNFTERIRSVLWSGVSLVILTDLPTIE